MKKTIVLISALILHMNALSIEDGTYKIERNSTNADNILGTSSIVLEKNQELTFIRCGPLHNNLVYFKIKAQDHNGSISESSDWNYIYLNSSNSPYNAFPKEAKTLSGPIEITQLRPNEDGEVIFRVSSTERQPKFSVSLNNAGDRLAVGHKEDGTNSVVKVYQFDGSSWNQLGENIE
jgi:hypothetical protein